MGSVPYKEQVVELVSGKMDEVSLILESSMENLNKFVEELKAFLRVDVTLSDLDFTVPNLNLAPASVPTPPTAPTVNTDIPLLYPETIQLTDIDIALPPVPDIDPTPPNIPERQLPEITISDFGAQPPSINTDIPIPARPSVTFPEAPTITRPTIRPFDGFSIPQIDGEAPEFLLNEIGVEYNHSEGVYSSELAPKIAAWLDNVLTNGGTGLAPEVEQAIFDAAVMRLEEEFVQTYDKELKFFASRGFRVPPGALRGALAEVHRLYSRKKQELRKEIMVKQAELAQANTHFAVEKAIAYEGMLREFFNQMANRLMENGKNAVTLALEVHNSKIATFNASAEAYRLKVGTYQAQIQALSLLSEAYKAELDAAKIAADIQSLDVQIYKEQLESIRVLAALYESDVRAAGLLMETERNKIEVFKGQVEAFSAQTAAQSARVNLFNALAENDKARATAYAEKMRGYGALVDAIKTRAETLIAKATLDNEIHNRMNLEVYKTNLGKIDSYAKNKISIEQLKLDKYRTDQTGYEAQVRGFAAHADVLIKEYTAKMQYAQSQIEMLLKEAELNQNSTIHLNTVKVETLKGLVQVMGQLVASALSAINASMQLGYSGGFHLSESWQGNTHKNESHNYQEYCDASCTG